MKTCTSCGIARPLEKFGKRVASKDGLSASCSECLKARDRARYPAERLKRLAQHKAYAAGVGKAACNAAKQKWTDNNKDKKAATTLVNNAIKYGRLTRCPCEVCGAKAQAHHEDYSKPLEVRWLCPVHHKARHKQMAIEGT